jgi:hypothetical protein
MRMLLCFICLSFISLLMSLFTSRPTLKLASLLVAFGLMTGHAWAQTSPAWASVRRTLTTGTNNYNYGTSIAMAADGSQYVTGPFAGTLTLGATTLTAGTGRQGLYVAKYSAAGVALWANKLEASSPIYSSVTVDAAGNAYVVGYFNSDITIGATTYTSTSPDAYIVKYDAQGALQWAQRGNGSFARAYGAAVDPAGNVAIVGSCANSVAFGGQSFSGSGPFYYKFSPAGAVLQAVRYSTSTSPKALAFDGAGNAYITGELRSVDLFGTSIVLSSAGGSDVFVCKLDGAGNPLWARRAGGTSDDGGYSIAVDGGGNAVVGGNYDVSASGPYASSIYLARFSTQGTPLWSRIIVPSAASDARAAGVAADGRGGYFVTGGFSGTAVFGSTSLTAVGRQAFVARYDGLGNAVWADRTVGASASGNDANAYAVATDTGGNAYVIGSAQGTVTFGSQATTGGPSTFVARLTAGGPLAARSASAAVPLAAYPNPATDFATLVLPAGGGRLAVLDALGRVVREQALPAAAGPAPVALAGLVPGLYQLRATLASGTVARTTLQVR